MYVQSSYLRYPLLIVLWVVALMSGVLSLARELYGLYVGVIPQKTLFWSFLWLAFVISASALWALERKKCRTLERALDEILPEVIIKIQELFHRRAESHLYWNADIFVLASAHLKKRESLVVQYRLEAIWKGRTTECSRVDDVDLWCRQVVDVEELGIPGSPTTTTRYLMDALTSALKREDKRDGWLHFELKNVPEANMNELTLRLGASWKDTVVGFDEIRVSDAARIDYSIIKKPAP